MAATESLQVILSAPPRVPLGAPVLFRLVLANQTDRRLTLYLSGRSVTFDITVTGPEGSVVWRRLEGQTIQGILQVRELGPREHLVLEDEWDQTASDGKPVPPGTYMAKGAILTDGAPLFTPSVSFAVGR